MAHDFLRDISCSLVLLGGRKGQEEDIILL